MIDSHCHLQAPELEAELETIIEHGLALGITQWVVNGTTESDWLRVAHLAEKWPDAIIPSFGLHPWYTKERSENWEPLLRDFLSAFPNAGVGEIGLDRWIKDHNIEDQIEVFRQQWEIGAELDRPITVHCLKAWGPLSDCLAKLPAHRFLLHSYSGSKELVDGFVKKGAFFSLSGYFYDPKKAAKLAVFHEIPKDRLLLETDAPAMPLPAELDQFPDTTFNHPGNLAVIYEKSRAAFPADFDSNVKRWLGTAG